jgi:peptide/nickel transport system substrate-binding protein
MKSDATRLAALASGEVDLVLDPPYQDIQRLQRDARIRLLQTADIGQQYLTFDQSRDELRVQRREGPQPLQGPARAPGRLPRHQRAADRRQGAARPGRAHRRLPVAAGRRLAAELDKRLPTTPHAPALLAEAGYPNGFAVTLDCVNVAWRENVCQAVAAMLTQVGIRTTLRSSPTNQFFPKLSQGTASFVEYGWTASPDAWPSLNGLFRTFDRSGLGTFNAGRYSNPKLDVLIDAIRVEPDLTRRRAMVAVALRMVAEDLPYVPLYRRTLNWAMAPRCRPCSGPTTSSSCAGCGCWC